MQRRAPGGEILRFTILTAARGNEARLAAWAEIDLAERLWRVPGSRMKSGKAHNQPLSRAALEVLERARQLDDRSGLIFPSPHARTPGKPISNAAMMVVVKRNGFAERMTVHGCRATFFTWADECTDTPEPVKDLSLAHAVGDKVRQAYARGEIEAKRRVLMEQWGEFATSGAPAAPPAPPAPPGPSAAGRSEAPGAKRPRPAPDAASRPAARALPEDAPCDPGPVAPQLSLDLDPPARGRRAFPTSIPTLIPTLARGWPGISRSRVGAPVARCRRETCAFTATCGRNGRSWDRRAPRLWWRRRESNPRPQALRLRLYMLSRVYLGLADPAPDGQGSGPASPWGLVIQVGAAFTTISCGFDPWLRAHEHAPVRGWPHQAARA